MAKHSIFTKTFHGELDAVRELLDADPSLVDLIHSKLTPLHTAAQRNRPEIIKLLVSRVAKVNHCKTGQQNLLALLN